MLGAVTGKPINKQEPHFTLGNVYCTKASGSQQITETTVKNIQVVVREEQEPGIGGERVWLTDHSATLLLFTSQG